LISLIKALGLFSGMGDGLGIKSIKEQRGFVLVQEPTTAKLTLILHHKTILVDIVHVEELPAKLIAFEHTVVENGSS
jgi:two-component system CheB/CheR fusion protein